MNTQWTGWVVGILLALGGTARSDDDRVTTKLKELGAFVRCDETKPGKPIVSVEVMGSLDKRKMTDADLLELAPLEQLRTLALYKAGITDAGLKHLAGC